MKPFFLSLINTHQFAGMDLEDPYTHLSTFYELVETMGFEENDIESVYLRLFPFSLARKAKEWLKSHPNQSLSSWNDVEEKFLHRFFHGFEDIAQLNIFHNGLRPDTKMISDAVGGGTMMIVDAKQATRIIDALASTDYQAQHDRYSVQKKGVLDLSVEDGCCPFKIVFDEDLYVVFDEDIYVLSMYLCFALSVS